MAISGSLTFAPGVTSQTLQVSILDDKLSESDETFQVILQNPVNAILDTAIATSIITDTLFSAATKTLPASIENLTLTEDGAINATGNANANRLTGNAQANVLKGRNGIDVLTGLGGNDIFDLTGLKANSHRDWIPDFTPGDRAQLSDSLTSLTGKGVPAWLEMAPQETLNLATDQFNLFVFNAKQTETDVDLSLTGKGAELLDGLNPSAGSAELFASAAGSMGYLLAYDNDDAYLYAFHSGADTIVTSSEIDLIATFANLAPGTLSAGDFQLI